MSHTEATSLALDRHQLQALRRNQEQNLIRNLGSVPHLLCKVALKVTRTHRVMPLHHRQAPDQETALRTVEWQLNLAPDKKLSFHKGSGLAGSERAEAQRAQGTRWDCSGAGATSKPSEGLPLCQASPWGPIPPQPKQG